MLNPNDMLTFLAVAETGSFTKAAEYLMTPKSNVSRKVSRLEESLGVRLMERSTRALHLTEAGVVYMAHCQRIRDEIEGAKQSVEALSEVPQGLIRMCTSVTVGQQLLGQHLIQFQKRYPQVSIDLKLMNRRVDLIEEGYDLAIRVGRSQDSNLVSKRLCKASLHLYACPEYLQCSPSIQSIDDLKKHPCLYMNSRSEKPQWPLLDGSATIEISPQFLSDDFQVLCQAAIVGLGIALLPDYLCDQAMAEGKLTRILPDSVGRFVDIYAVFPSRKGMMPKLRSLLDYFDEVL